MHLAQSRETRTMMKVSQQRGLSVARSARRRMLGEGDQEHAGLTMATVTQPSEGLGGDVPGFVPLGDHHAGLFVLGVEGRDLGPTLLTSSIHALLTMDPVLGPLQLSMDLNGDFMLPADLLAFLERAFPAERFGWHHRITYVLADGRDGSFRFASRGTPPLLHCATRRGEVRVLGDPAAEGTAMVLGEGMLEPGDLLVAPGSFLATPTGPTGRPFAGEPLESSLRQNLDPDSDDPMDDLNTAVLFALDRHLSGTVPAVDLAIALLGYRTES